MMHPTVLSPVGVEVTDLDLDHLEPGDVDRIRQLLADRGVMVVPAQSLDDARFLQFLRSFGEILFATGETPVAKFPDLNVISNVGRTRPPRSVFHVDTSYVRAPPTYTALRTVKIPAQGGETLFTNQYRAYATLPDEVKKNLQGRTIKHVVTGLDLGPEDETEADHPVFRRHPISGRIALYLSTPERCVSISGMAEAPGREMIKYLYDHSITEDNVYRHTWSPGDVVMWDNGCVLHRADHGDVHGDRVMHRGMVIAESAGARRLAAS